MKPTTIKWIDRVATFLPIVGTAVLLTIATFFPHFLDQLPDNLLVAVMAVSFVALAVHLEIRFEGLHARTHDLQEAVTELGITQQLYLDATSPAVVTKTLADAFDHVVGVGGQWTHLRIYAVTSLMILGLIRSHRVKVRTCHVLVRSCTPGPQRSNQVSDEIKRVEETWLDIEQSGSVEHVRIRHYGWLPTEYEVIIDDRFLILGLYEPYADGYAGVVVLDAVVFDGSSPEGARVVKDYIRRFDGMFEKSTPDCKSAVQRRGVREATERPRSASSNKDQDTSAPVVVNERGGDAVDPTRGPTPTQAGDQRPARQMPTSAEPQDPVQ